MMVEFINWVSATWVHVGFHAALWVGFAFAIVVFAVALIHDWRKTRKSACPLEIGNIEKKTP